MRQKRRRDPNVGLVGESGRRSGAVIETGWCQERRCREISNPEADLQLIAPRANWKLFKSRFAKARKMNLQLNRRGAFRAESWFKLLLDGLYSSGNRGNMSPSN